MKSPVDHPTDYGMSSLSMSEYARLWAHGAKSRRATPEDVWPTIARMFGDMLVPVRSMLSMEPSVLSVDDITKSTLRLWKNTNIFMRTADIS